GVPIRAVLAGPDDGAAGSAAVFSREGTGDDLEFADRVDRGAGDLRAQLLHVRRDRVFFTAIEQEVVLQRSIAVDAHAAGAAGVRGAGLFGVAVALHAR